MGFFFYKYIKIMDPEIKLVTYTALAIVGEQGIGPLQEIR